MEIQNGNLAVSLAQLGTFLTNKEFKYVGNLVGFKYYL